MLLCSFVGTDTSCQFGYQIQIWMPSVVIQHLFVFFSNSCTVKALLEFELLQWLQPFGPQRSVPQQLPDSMAAPTLLSCLIHKSRSGLCFLHSATLNLLQDMERKSSFTHQFHMHPSTSISGQIHLSCHFIFKIVFQYIGGGRRNNT